MQAPAAPPSSPAAPELYSRDPDPWGCDTRWYERRKRALLLACLPRPRYRRAYEPGCGNGALTAALAARCDRLLASDASTAGVRLTRERVGSMGWVAVRHELLPAEWPRAGVRPDGAGAEEAAGVETVGAGDAGLLAGFGPPFDLIVLSELGYYFDHAGWMEIVQGIVETLAPGGTLAAVHWRRHTDPALADSARLHAHLAALPGLHTLVEHVEEDFLLGVWSRDERPVSRL
jgi:SAM-dependent methyltransferase